MEDSIKKGLNSIPKYLPSWFRYDKQGSIYNDLCFEENEGYYFHKTEVSILKDNIEDMVKPISERPTVIDMGSGNCEKTCFVIDCILRQREAMVYIPIDISKEFLDETMIGIHKSYGNCLNVQPIAAEFHECFKNLNHLQHEEKIILWLGGGLQGESMSNQSKLLKQFADIMTDKCFMIVSMDITSDEGKVMDAYLDKKGISGRLHLNHINRLNRDYGANIDLEKLELNGKFIYNDNANEASYMKVWVRAKEDLSLNIPGLNFCDHMKEGQTIQLHHGEAVSCKYTMIQLTNLAERSGLLLKQHWTDEKNHVAICKFMKHTATVTP